MFMNFKSYVFFTIISCFLVLGTFPSLAAGRVERIEISGAERIEESTIASYMEIKTGDDVDSIKMDRVLKSLFATGLFADVKLGHSNGVLNVNVQENPVINDIVFEGNSDIEDGELASEIQLRQRQVFTRTKVQSDVKRIYQIYRRQGRFSASVQPKVIRLDQNRVDLIFEIQEGEITKIKSIRFVGNKKYDDAKLRSVVSSKEKAWYRFLSNNDRYDPDRLDFDQQLLREYYFSQGYADFQILSSVAELSDNKDFFFLTMTVDEGRRYKVMGTEITSQLRDFDSSVLLTSITFNEGDWYDADKVKSSVRKMTNRYS